MQRNYYSAAQFYSGTRTVIDLRTLTLKPWCFKFIPKTVHSVHNRKFSACTSCFSFRCKFCGILGYIWPGSVLKTSDCLYVAKTETFGILNSSIVATIDMISTRWKSITDLPSHLEQKKLFLPAKIFCSACILFCFLNDPSYCCNLSALGLLIASSSACGITAITTYCSHSVHL